MRDQNLFNAALNSELCMSRYRFSLSIHSVTTLLVGTTFGLSCNIALAASNLDCEKLLNARDLSKAQSVCQQALMSQQQAASREQKKPLIEAYAKAHHNLGMLYTLLGKPIETERHFRNQIEILDKLYPQGSVTTAQAYIDILPDQKGGDSYY